MKINFGSVSHAFEHDLEDHFAHLAKPRQFKFILPEGFTNETRQPPEGYEDYVCVDVLGEELVWLNENFPQEQYTWYLWFESVFLVTPEMATFLALRWK